MTATIRISAPHDLLALIPTLAGFRPERSLVCLVFREDRVVGVLRYDLPREAAERAPLVDAALDVFRRIRDADGIVLVTYSDGRYRCRAAGGERALLRLLARRAKAAGLVVRDVLRVASDGWGSMLDSGTPDGGHPLDLVDASPVTRHPAILGRHLGTIDEGTAVPDVGVAEAEAVGIALQALEAELDADVDAGGIDGPDAPGGPDGPDGPDGPAVPTGPTGRHRRFEDLLARPVDLVESMLDRPPGAEATTEDVERSAWLIKLAGLPVCRDAMMLQVAFGPSAGRLVLDDAITAFRAASARDDPLEPAPEEGPALVALGRMVLGDTTERPNPDRVERGMAVILRVVAAAPARERAGLLCMAGWLAWGLGRGSAASGLLQRALTADAGHSMARLLAQYVGTGALPAWLFQDPERAPA